MGNWYKNLTTYGPDRPAVVSALARLERHAYVTPTRGAVTVVFDRASDETSEPDELGDLALTLSQELNCPCLAAAVFGDDVLLLGLYSSGRQVGEYNSAGGSTLGAGLLSSALGVPRRAPPAWLLLHTPRMPLFLLESFRHRVLLQILGQPPWAFATGYKYIANGEPPEDLEETDLLHVSGSPGERA